MSIHNYQDFEPVLWEHVANGDQVFLSGTHDGKRVAYGPHTVKSVKERKLRSSAKFEPVFMYYSEDLLRRKDEEGKQH